MVRRASAAALLLAVACGALLLLPPADGPRPGGAVREPPRSGASTGAGPALASSPLAAVSPASGSGSGLPVASAPVTTAAAVAATLPVSIRALRGRILDEGDRPVPGALVRVFALETWSTERYCAEPQAERSARLARAAAERATLAPDESRARRPGIRGERLTDAGCALTGPDGGYTIAPLASGAGAAEAFRLDVSARRGAELLANSQYALSEHSRRAVHADGVLDLGDERVVPTVTMGIRVRESGRASPGTSLWGTLCWDAYDDRKRVNFSEPTGEDGLLLLRAPANAKAYRLSVEARRRGFATEARSLTLDGGGEVVIDLSPAATIEGRVLAPDGSPVSSVVVSALAGSPFVCIAWGTSDESGRYTIGALRPGQRYWLKARSESGAFVEETRLVAVAPKPDANLALRAAGAVSVTVTGPELDRLPSVLVASKDPLKGWRWVADLNDFSGEDGAFAGTAERLAPGRLRLRVTVDGFAPAFSEPFDLEAGRTIGVTVALTPRRSVTLKATDARGAALSELELDYSVEGLSSSEILSFEDGQFFVLTLPTRDVEVVFRSPGFEPQRVLVRADETELKGMVFVEEKKTAR